MQQKSKQGGAVPRNRKTNKKSQRVRTKTVIPSSAAGVLPHLSDCSSKYMKVLANPFMGLAGVCIPDAICLPSFKVSFTARGTFNTGTIGFGFIGLNPWSMIGNNPATTLVGSSAPIWCTSPTYPNGFAIPAINSSNTANLFPGTSNSTYTFQQVSLIAGGPNINFRLVGSGLRVRYIGTELNRGGRITMFRNRDNFPYTNNFNANSVLSDKYFHTSPVDRQWKEITYMPSRTEDISYSFYNDPSTSPNTDYRIMWAIIDGTIPNSSFEYEVISYFELVGGGNGLALPISPSHSDPTGFGAVLSSIPTTLKETGTSLLNSMSQGVSRALTYATSGLITAGARAIGGYFGGPLGSAVGGGAAGLLMAGPRIEEVD